MWEKPFEKMSLSRHLDSENSFDLTLLGYPYFWCTLAFKNKQVKPGLQAASKWSKARSNMAEE